jgi:hypothetical protein
MATTHRVLRGLVPSIALALALSGCGGLPGFGSSAPSVAPVPPASSTAVTPSVTPASPKPTAKPAARNDLRSGQVKRSFRVPGLTVSTTYQTPLAINKWTPDVTKPLNVTLTAYADKAKAQKIYLTRVRANISVSDNSGRLDSPDALVDTANISPGFIVTFPYTYGQVFVIPSVDTGATSITIDFTYEFLLQVTPSSKDYAKQSARDSLTIALT